MELSMGYSQKGNIVAITVDAAYVALCSNNPPPHKRHSLQFGSPVFVTVLVLCRCYWGSAWLKPAKNHSIYNRDNRVASYFYYNSTLNFGCLEPKKVLYGNKIRCLDVFCENPLPYGGLVWDGKFFL